MDVSRIYGISTFTAKLLECVDKRNFFGELAC